MQGTGANISVIRRREQNEVKYTERLKDLIYEKGRRVLEKRDIQVILIEDECIQKYNQRNALEIRHVDEGLCSNCGVCYNQFHCSALKEKGAKVRINSSECLGCGICEELCPNNAILGGDNDG